MRVLSIYLVNLLRLLKNRRILKIALLSVDNRGRVWGGILIIKGWQDFRENGCWLNYWLLNWVWVFFDFWVDSDDWAVLRLDLWKLRWKHFKSVIQMDHTHISYTLFFFEVICNNAFSKHDSFKLPIYYLILGIDVEFDCSNFPFFSWLAHSPPRSRPFILHPFSIVNFSVGKMKSERLLVHFVFNWDVVLGSYSKLYAVQLWLDNFERNWKFSFLWQRFWHFDNVP